MADIRDEMTERLLDEAGIGAGMRVLDIGCGHGDVTMMIARRVGEKGHVLGIDRDARPLETARDRAWEQGLANVSFAESDLSALAPEHGAFDAIVGRRVLMYQPDPAHAVRQLAAALHPGGRMVFQEHDATMTPGRMTPLPLHERIHEWVWRTVEREGADIHMGFHLPAVFAQAGLAIEQVRAEAVVLLPETPYPFGAIVRAMLPRIVQHGVATAEELDIDTLDQRLREERASANAVYVGDMVFSAWARKKV